jgi:hypothetical protein
MDQQWFILTRRVTASSLQLTCSEADGCDRQIRVDQRRMTAAEPPTRSERVRPGSALHVAVFKAASYGFLDAALRY